MNNPENSSNNFNSINQSDLDQNTLEIEADSSLLSSNPSLSASSVAAAIIDGVSTLSNNHVSNHNSNHSPSSLQTFSSTNSNNQPHGLHHQHSSFHLNNNQRHNIGNNSPSNNNNNNNNTSTSSNNNNNSNFHHHFSHLNLHHNSD